ncbi:50S ribosomal protein L6 [Halobacteriales archaeon SW_7_71_33]|nr:MAG: 50S ribosomal protein L6 [Halobacteriales archaeon SW_7_71_33]
MTTEIQIPDDVTVTVDGLDARVEGPNGAVERQLWYPGVSVDVEDETVRIESEQEDRQTNATVGTFESHLRNAFHGVTEGWEYEMEIRYEHFPMQVRVDGDEVVIDNFLGEQAPRRCAVVGDTEVEVDDPVLTVRGPDKEDVGQTVGNVHETTRINDKDTRVFEDGIYVTEAPGGEVTG